MSLNLRCPKKRILFQFIETTRSGSFNNSTDWGFEIKKPDADITTPRWCEVLVVGKDVTAVKPGQYALVEAMMWTNSFTYENHKYWATAEDKVIGLTDTLPTNLL